MSSPFFFHTKEFVYRNTDPSIVHFQVDAHSIYFAIVDNILISLPRSTFGSFVLPDEVDPKNISLLIEQAIDYARFKKCESIEVRCHPEIFSSENSAKINEILLSSGFHIKYKDITQVLFCNQQLHLDLSRRRRFSICEEAGFIFDELKKENLPQAYDLFLQSRNSKGYPITMQLQDFLNAFNQFPDRYFLYGVKDNDKLVAASVTVSLNESILYYFFAGDDLAYRKQSPSTFLICNLFDEAVRMNYQLIDLGISTDKGVLNKGLYDFKKSFGAVDSLKLTFEKVL